MAKKGNSTLRAGLKAYGKLHKQMNREAMADFRVVASAGRAGTANLRAQLGRIERAAYGALGQDMNALGRGIRGEARGGARVTRAREAATVRRYGNALAGSIGNSFRTANVAEAGTKATVGALTAQGKEQLMTARTVSGIAASGAAAQQAAGDYAFHQALMARNIVSAETIASLTGDLYQSAINAELQWQNTKREMDYAAKLAEEEAKKNGLDGGQQAAEVKRLAGEGSNIAVDAANAWREARDAAAQNGGNFEDISVMDIATNWAAEYGYGADSPEVKVFVATLQQLKRAPGGEIDTGVAYSNAIEQLYGGYQGWNKWGAPTVSAGMSAIHSQLLDALNAYNEAKNGNGPGDDAKADAAAKKVRALTGVDPGELPIAGKGGIPLNTLGG